MRSPVLLARARRAQAPSRARVSDTDRAATQCESRIRIESATALGSEGEADWTPGMAVVGRPRGILPSHSHYRLNWDGPVLARRHANGRNRRVHEEDAPRHRS